MYYRIVEDSRIYGHWHLDTVLEEGGDRSSFWSLLRSDRSPADARWHVGISEIGIPLDFSFSRYDVPIVNKKIKMLIQSLCPAEVSFLLVSVDGFPQEHYILSVRGQVDGIDESELVTPGWERLDAGKGQPLKLFRTLRLDDSKIPENFDLFRLNGWNNDLICSDLLKDLLVDEHVTGLRFEAVQ